MTHVYNHMPAVRPELTSDGKLAGGTVASGYTGHAVPLDAEALRVAQDEIYIGATVLDVDDKNLGTLQDYDGDSGYMRIEKDGFTVKDIFLPVTSVSFLDEQGIHLSEAKDTLWTRPCRSPAQEPYGSLPPDGSRPTERRNGGARQRRGQYASG